MRAVCGPVLGLKRDDRPCCRTPTLETTVSNSLGLIVSRRTRSISATCCSVFSTRWPTGARTTIRSEEHTSELQSQSNLVCRLLLEKKKKQATEVLLSHTSQ